jgi:hypothetical protein
MTILSLNPNPVRSIKSSRLVDDRAKVKTDTVALCISKTQITSDD